MATFKAWSILALGLLAAACAGGKQSIGSAGEPTRPTGEPQALPGEHEAPATDEQGDFEAVGAPEPAAPEPSAAPSSASPPPAESFDSRRGAERSSPSKRSEAKARRPLDVDDRPGLGTTWGETRTSHVSNAPFERAGQNPFAVTTVRYNDQAGIAAMLRGATLTDFQADAPTTAGGAITVRLLDANGTPLPTFMNQGRTLVSGEHGQRYVIELANRTSSRFEAVVTVDGLDVIDGRPGSFSKRGYLVQPFATVEIDGFRQNMAEVAAFRFGSVRGSYAAKKGDDRNVGVIGVAVFAERGARVWSERELVRREGADPFPGRFASPPIAR